MAIKNLFERLMKPFVSRSIEARDLSVDAFRGLAILLMIFVNHAPPHVDVYAIFSHADWSGWTVADTIFPTFLFIVGVSITFVRRSGESVRHKVPYGKILRRTALLIAIGLLLVNFPYYELANFKVEGTLFRIGVCYMAASLVFYCCSVRVQVACLIALLAAQAVVLTYLDIPGVPPGTFTPEVNPSNYLDGIIFGKFVNSLILYGPATQGLVPTAGAIASTLMGLLTGHWLRTTTNIDRRVNGLFASGFLLLIVGTACSVVIPINKQVWTPSYVVFMGGVSLQVLAIFYWYIEILGFRRFVGFLRVAGVNALFFYVFAQVVQRVLVYGRVYEEGGTATRLRYYIFDNWFSPLAPEKPAALIYTLCFLAFCYGVVYWLYRRRLFFKL